MEPRRVNVIGAGRIATPVLAFLRESPDWRLGLCLVRGVSAAPEATADVDCFFSDPADLIIEVAGPAALLMHGARALALADVWTVSAGALADRDAFDRLDMVGRAHGHRLRLLSGAIGGLDGVAAASVDPQARLHVTAARPGMAGNPGQAYSGPLAEAAERFPHEVNIAVAAALAGPGIARTSVTLLDPGEGGAHVLSLSVESRFGRFEAVHTIEADPAKRIHPVAASIIAALKRESQTIRAG
jgi:aspartate dehydrogenase